MNRLLLAVRSKNKLEIMLLSYFSNAAIKYVRLLGMCKHCETVLFIFFFYLWHVCDHNLIPLIHLGQIVVTYFIELGFLSTPLIVERYFRLINIVLFMFILLLFNFCLSSITSTCVGSPSLMSEMKNIERKKNRFINCHFHISYKNIY